MYLESTWIFQDFIFKCNSIWKIVFPDLPRKLTAQTCRKFAPNIPIYKPEKNPQKFQEVKNNPDITPVKGELLTPYDLKMKNKKQLLNLISANADLTYHHPKFKNTTKSTSIPSKSIGTFNYDPKLRLQEKIMN